MLSVGVFGFGRWGENLARCVTQCRSLTLKTVCDPAAERRAAAAAAYPTVLYESDPDRLSQDAGIDAVVIATPATTHFEIARKALRAGKHVLVEKPIALSSGNVLRLADEADQRRLVLMIDHTYLFSPAVRAIRRIVESGDLGTIQHLRSVRTNRDGGRALDVSALWDLATHDLSIIDYVFGRNLNKVRAAAGANAGRKESEDDAELSLHFSAGLAADVHVNRSGPAKVRRIVMTGTRKTLIFDDVKPVAKIEILDTGPARGGDHNTPGAGVIPPIEDHEPLLAVFDHFAACVIGGTQPLSDAASGHRITQWLEAAERSLADGGRAVDVGAVETVR